MSTNIDYWEKVVKNPTEVYKNLFYIESEYLRKNILPNSKVLDIGCGDGRNIKSIIDITQNIVGLDNDERAVNDAKNNLKQYQSIEIILGDACQLPFEDGIFDFTILSMTLVNFGDEKIKSLKEMKRVIKGDGKIIISVYSENALNQRLIMYRQAGATPKVKDKNNGFVAFEIDGSEIEGLISKQFTLKQMEDLVSEVGLKIVNMEEVENLAYIFTLETE